MENKFKLSKTEMVTLANKDISEYVWQILKFNRSHITFPEVKSIVDGRVLLNMEIEDVVLVHSIVSILKKIILANESVNDMSLFDIICLINDELAGIKSKSIKNTLNDCVKDDIKTISTIPCDTEKAIELLIYCIANNVFPSHNGITALLTANYIMVKNCCGLLLPPPEKRHILRELIESYKDDDKDKLKEFIYNDCVFGVEGVYYG